MFKAFVLQSLHEQTDEDDAETEEALLKAAE